MQVSTFLTIGSALTRAAQDDLEVAVLVQGEWFRGHVQGLDGHGLVLDDGEGHHLVVRLEQVAVLRIEQEKDPWATEESHHRSVLHDDAAMRMGPVGQPDVPRPRADRDSELTL